MNKTSRKVIVVEDDKMLQTVFSLFLQELGHELIGAFSTADEAFLLCEKKRADVVLLDINLPEGIDGITASNRFFTEYNIPVIYISSYTDDTTVSNAINYSAYGYLVKPIDKVSLGITIDLVCWRHEYEQQKKISEQLLEYIQHAVFTISLSGKIINANRAFETIFKIANPVGKLFYEITNISEDEFQTNIVEEVLRNRYYNQILKLEIERKKVFIQCNYSLLFDEINEVYAIAVFAQEITSLIEFSEGFKKVGSIQTAFFNGISQMVLLFDIDNQLILFNQLASKFYETKLKHSLVENDKIENVLFFLQNTEITSLVQNVKKGIYHFTERIVEVEQSPIFIQINWVPVELEGNVSHIMLLLSDITMLRKLEMDYEEQKNELKPIFDSSIQRFYLVDLNLNIIAFNKSARDVIYKEFNFALKKGDNALDLIPQQDRKKYFLEQFEKAKQGHSVFFKESYPLKNEIRWNETHLDPVVNERGEIKRVLIWTLDITDREQYLRDLKESQERYELIARGGNDGIFDWDLLRNTVYLSPRWKALLGYEDYELKNEFGTRDSLIHPEDKEKAKKILNDYLEGKTPYYENEFRLMHKRGYYIWVIERGELLKDENGNIIRLAGSITDITRLKKIENNLLQLNKTLLDERKMFMQGSVVITRIKADETKKFIYISENVKDVLGYSVDDFTSGAIVYDELIHPEDIEMHTKERNEAIQKQVTQISFSPYRMRKKDGSYIWVKDFSTIITNENDNTNDILGYFIDITEEKKFESAILESNKRYVSLFEEASDAIILLDGVRIIEANRNAEILFGYSKDELKQMDILILSPDLQHNFEKSTDRFNRKILNAMAGESKAFYWQFKNKENKIVDTEVGLSPIVVNNKRILYQAIIRNITDRKKIERALKENEQKVNALLQAIPDLLFILDENNIYIYFKPDRDKIFDVPHEQVIGKSVSDFFTGELLERYVNCIDKCRTTKQIVDIQYELNSPIGMRKYEARLTPLDNKQILQVVRDLGPANV
ncbi:MAG: PAS domain S-box protein [Bacteroidales bacterium]|nr:PAS domain S-box protein [Bacteroidales bacterium]